jgi:WD40 repeat protein
VCCVDFHDTGELASGSLDHLCRVRDTETGKSRQTLIGRVEAINSFVWRSYGFACTGSGNKTVWVPFLSMDKAKDNFAQHCCCPFTRLSRWSPLDVELIHVSRLSKNEHPLRTELDSSCISAAFGARSPLVSRNSKPLVHLVV